MNTSPNNDWQKVKDIFDDALRRSPDERAEFIREACGENEELWAEVNSLLASHQSAETFLEMPAVIQVAENLMPDENRLVSGQVLGHYEIRDLLGSGGMGEVYLARDRRLNRNVAIKVLRENFRPDHHAHRRLLREARAAAVLEHPNICQIYEIAETPDHPFIVMQYVVGTTLSDLMAKERLSISHSLDLASQILDGLAEAHAQGIIHRDIKPGNVIINQKGQAKILDFGLAKFIEAEAAAETSQRLNSSGAVMGTVPFMSPEQLRGKFVDERSDLFSFGSLLYEMISGKPAFNRENNAETIAAILNDEPDWSAIPERLRPILKRCLSKEKDQRYGSASEVLKDLQVARAKGEFEDTIQTSTSPTGRAVTTDGSPPRKGQSHVWQSADLDSGRSPVPGNAEGKTAPMTTPIRKLWQPAATALLLIALGGSALFVWQKYGQADSTSSFDSLRPVRLTQWRSGASGHNTDFRVSHDGKFVAYSSSQDGDEVIYIKQTGGGEEIPITKDEWKNISPIWSPDDQRIAFVSIRENKPGIYVVPSLGGSATLILTSEKANISLRHWSKDQTFIYYEQLGNLYRADIATRSTQRITDFPDSQAGNDRYFTLSPDESVIAYCDAHDGQRDIWTVPVAGGEPKRVTNDEGEEHRPIWHPDGQRILYNVLRNDFYQINLAYRDTREPVQVTRGEGNYELIDISPDGTRIYYTAWEKRSDISAVNTNTGEEVEVAAGIEVEMWPEVSPDGKSVVYQTNTSPNPTANLNESVLIVKFTDGRRVPVAKNGYNPRWLPDSRQIAFLRWHEAERKSQLWIVDTVSGQERQLTTDSVSPPSISLMPIVRADVGEFDFSPDGGRFVYLDSQRPRSLRIAGQDGGGSTKLTDTPADVRYSSTQFSPDGERIACVSVRMSRDNNSKKPEWSVMFFEGGKVATVQVPGGSIRLLGWAGSGDGVTAARTAGPMKTGPDDVEIVRISPSQTAQTITTLHAVYADSVALGPDGRTLAFTGRRTNKDDVWTISTAGGEARKVTNNGNTRIFYANLAWAPDGKTIYFDKQEQINTISMFENFR